MADFMSWLDDVNRLAECSQGFVWRLQGASGNSTDLKVGDDPLFIVNLTLWETPDDLFMFTYRSDHKAVFARRFDWFERSPGPNIALWWQATGTTPTIEDALLRLRLLAAVGPNPEGGIAGL